MLACSPGMACTDEASSLDRNNDTCNRCPWVDAVCPAEGVIVIQTAPLSTGSRYRCDFSVRDENGQSLAPIAI